MTEIESLPWNGFKVASTFSGCGGSCLGYRMAGYQVVWANEFVPAACDSYRANHSATILDSRDIRLVQPADILGATGLGIGELDLFDGSPPCQAFSTAGKRAKGWGDLKMYEGGAAAQQNEDMFTEYIRLLDGLQPKTFVAENVSGLVKGVAKGYFLDILAGLKACGYRVTCRVLDAQWLGVPQSRQRTIFVGVREDIGIEPVHPKPLTYRYSVRDALPHAIAHGTGPSFADWKAMNRDPLKTFIPADRPVQSILASGVSLGVGMVEDAKGKRKFTIPEVMRLCAFPDDFVLVGSFAQQWERLGNSVPPVMMFHIASAIRDEVLLNAGS